MPAITSEQRTARSVVFDHCAQHNQEVSEAWEAELQMLWQRLRAPLLRNALPLRTVASRSGYSVGFISEVLRGRKRPSPDAAAAITTALGGTEADARAARTYAERMRDSPVGHRHVPKHRPTRNVTEPEWPCRVGVVPHTADCWQRRQLGDNLASDPPGVPTPEPTRILTGLGGVGKTQMAAAHAHHLWRHGALEALIWVNAGHHHDIVTAYAQAARVVTGIEDSDDTGAAHRFLNWAANTDRSWLVVLDDLTTPSDLVDLWPPHTPAGRTLITTRRRDAALAGDGRTFITVQPFTAAESTAYLARKFAAHPRRMRGAARLADELGHLPVAMAQAAAYIEDRGLTCDEYCQRLTGQLAKFADLLPESDALPDNHPAAVSATWSLSVRLADRLRPKGLARPLLDVAAFLDPNGIPELLFRHRAIRSYLASRRPATAGPAGIQATDASDALGSLHRLNLVTVDDTAGLVRVHALVQRATRDAMSRSRTRSVARAAADALNTLWTQIGGSATRENSLRSNTLVLYRRAPEHLVRGGVHPVLFRATTSLGRSGHVAAAADLARRFTETAMRLLGDDHPDTLAGRGDLAFWQGEAGSPANAAAAAQRLVVDCARVLGPDHRQTLTARHHVAGWHGRAGAPTQAVTELHQLLGDRIRVLGPDDPDTLNNRNSLAAWRGYAGDPHSAVTELRAVLADRVRVLGVDDPETLDTRHHLAQWLGEAGDPAAAVEAFTALSQDRLRVLGSSHRDTLATRYRLARWRAASGDVDHAVTALRQVVEDCAHILGATHPDTLTARTALANLQGEQGDPHIAVAILEAVLADRRQVLEPTHPDITTTRDELRRWRWTTGTTGETSPDVSPSAPGCVLDDRKP